MYIITDILGPSLYDAVVKPKKHLQTSELQIIIRDILTALVFFKSKGIIHCDIKPENLLYTSLGSRNIKVVDFGSSTFIDDVEYSYLQTRPYRAPEIVFGCKFDFSVDMWSLGCVVYELIAHKFLFKYKSVEENMAKALAISHFNTCEMFAKGSAYPNIVSQNRFLVKSVITLAKTDSEVVLPSKNFHLSEELRQASCKPELIDFIYRCLRLSPAERMTPEEALEHPFLKI